MIYTLKHKAAIAMKKAITLLISITSVIVNCESQTVTDTDGNIYNTITIGTQVWMKENLKVIRYRNGDSIETTFPATKDIALDIAPKYQWAYDGDEMNVATNGRLYTWHVVMDDRGICPTNWHIPSDSDWTVLFNLLGGEDIAGGKMKEAGTTHWISPNAGADNSSGFAALPSGYRHTEFFSHFGKASFWWSTSPLEMNSQWKPSLSYFDSDVTVYGNAFRSKSLGFSVRCLKDESTSGTEDINDNKIYIFPSPATDKITIAQGRFQDGKLSIYNVAGSLMLQSQIIDKVSTIDISSLPNGVYLIQLSTADATVQQRLIKQ